MSRFRLLAGALLALFILGNVLVPTSAGPAPQQPQQQPPQQQAPPLAPPKPYKVVPITLPKPMGDASHAAFLKQLAGIAQKKDKAALGRLIAKDFFWFPDEKDVADKRKSGIENLSKALGLDSREINGWEVLAFIVADPTTEPHPDRKGVVCGPGGPTFDDKAAEEVAAATGTDDSEWGYTARDGVIVRQGAEPNSPQIEKLGLQLVRVYPEDNPSAQGDSLRIVTPSGKVGFVKGDEVLPLATDQLCYVKEGNAWKIAGVIGGAP